MIETPTIQDVEDLAYRGREEDHAEVMASHGLYLYDAVLQSIDKSQEAWAIRHDDKLLGITGIVAHKDLLSYTASPWLITTYWVDSYPKETCRQTKRFLDRWNIQWPVLDNYIDARYKKALRWAKWAGFTIYPASPYGYAQLPFCYIRRVRWE